MVVIFVKSPQAFCIDYYYRESFFLSMRIRRIEDLLPYPQSLSAGVNGWADLKTLFRALFRKRIDKQLIHHVRFPGPVLPANSDDAYFSMNL
jgi:hypothetical protein